MSASVIADDEFPAQLAPLVRIEVRNAFRPPFVAPSVVLINGLLMTGAWFLLPARWQAALFSVHGTFVFALVLASWMYADVPATNVLGNDAEEALATLDDPNAFRRLLTAHSVVLWLLVTPVCFAVAVGIGIYEHDWDRLLVTLVSIAFPPFGALGIAAWLGVWFPYRPIALAERWKRRAEWRHLWFRWGALVLLPYAIVPWVGALTLLPAYAIWANNGKAHNVPVDHLHLVAGALLTVFVSLTLWFIGRWVSVRIAQRKREYLREYLADPSRG